MSIGRTARTDPSTEHAGWRARAGHFVALSALIGLYAVLTSQLLRTGHNTGDDFTLYLRQAQSIFQGNWAQVVADNTFSVVHSGGLFSPRAYPWGFPLLLSPFVHLWELDYERLKLFEVAVWCVFLFLFHGIVRRRINRVVAWVLVTFLAMSPLFLRHADSLLSEFPHLMTVAVVVWWMDRTLTSASWLTASRRSLVILGLLAAFCFNTRREGLVFFGVFLVGQATELIVRWRAAGAGRSGLERWRRRPALTREELANLATPHLAFAAGIVGFQLLLPTALVPDNGDRFGYIPTRSKEAVDVIADQLGFGMHTAWGVTLLALAAVGALIALARRPTLHAPIIVLAIGSGLMVGTHFRMVSRYYFQVTPWVLLYATYAVVVIVDGLVTLARTRRLERGAGSTVPLGVGSIVAIALMLVMMPSKTSIVLEEIDEVQAANDIGPQYGPAADSFQSVFAAVDRETEPDAIVGFFRARMLTLYTDRRTIQTGSIDTMARNADYFAMQKNSTYSQPVPLDGDLDEYEMTIVWEDSSWRLYRFGDWRSSADEDGG